MLWDNWHKNEEQISPFKVGHMKMGLNHHCGKEEPSK